MTQVSDATLEAMHTAATDIFTGALKACDIPSAFDHRLRFEGPPASTAYARWQRPRRYRSLRLQTNLRHCDWQSGRPMLQVLLDRMKRRKGLRGICCTNQPPADRNWRFRYFEGGHPLPNEDSFAAARAVLSLLRKARKDTLVFFLISERRLRHLRFAPRPADHP